MGQQPNISIDEGELPREGTVRAAEPRWSPDRPGEITGPDDVPVSSAFGHPGPDAGWALRLISLAEFDRGERPKALHQLLLALMSARASANGRAPVPQDLNMALSLLGLRGDDLEPATVEYLTDRRSLWLDAIAHESPKGAAALTDIPSQLLLDTPVRARARLNAQPDLVAGSA
jgi:hypothetical protein